MLAAAHRQPDDTGRPVAVLTALARWAGSRRSAPMYLQVTSDSTAGRRLYQRAGFRQACTYHYRVAGPSDSAAGSGAC